MPDGWSCCTPGTAAGTLSIASSKAAGLTSWHAVSPAFSTACLLTSYHCLPAAMPSKKKRKEKEHLFLNNLKTFKKEPCMKSSLLLSCIKIIYACHRGSGGGAGEAVSGSPLSQGSRVYHTLLFGSHWHFSSFFSLSHYPSLKSKPFLDMALLPEWGSPSLNPITWASKGRTSDKELLRQDEKGMHGETHMLHFAAARARCCCLPMLCACLLTPLSLTFHV